MGSFGVEEIMSMDVRSPEVMVNSCLQALGHESLEGGMGWNRQGKLVPEVREKRNK